MGTAEQASGFFGDKLYQVRARRVLPILVRQAEVKKPVYYEDLAQEVNMSNPRNLNYPLGCIGRALNDLAKEWGEGIPHIQALVINQQSHLPGPGFDAFLIEKGFRWDTKDERGARIEEYWARIYAYPYWSSVLEALRLQPTETELTALIQGAGRGGGGGEGADHLALKEYVGRNPQSAGLAIADPHGKLEHCLPSGDSIDVLFYLSHRIHAVEVKPASSSKQDIARGLFQCVKYRAVLQAEAGYRHDKRRITVCLVLGGLFPKDLIPLRNSLEVAVIDSVLVTLSALETVAMPAPESAIHSLERGSRRQLSKK